MWESAETQSGRSLMCRPRTVVGRGPCLEALQMRHGPGLMNRHPEQLAGLVLGGSCQSKCGDYTMNAIVLDCFSRRRCGTLSKAFEKSSRLGSVCRPSSRVLSRLCAMSSTDDQLGLTWTSLTEAMLEVRQDVGESKCRIMELWMICSSNLQQMTVSEIGL